MAIKLKNFAKNLGANNPYIKVFSLFFMFLSAAIFIETVAFIYRDSRNFLDVYFLDAIHNNSWYDSILIRKFFLFGPGVYVDGAYVFWGLMSILVVSFLLIFCSFHFYKKNFKTPTFFDSFIKYLYNKTPLEIIILLVFISIEIARYGMHRKLYMYDKFVFYDIAALYLVYLLISYAIHNKNNLFEKLYCSKIIKALLDKHNKQSLNKKLAIILIIVILLQLIIVLLIFMRIRILPICLSVIICVLFIKIYNSISSKFQYIDYLSNEVESIKEGSLDYKLDIRGNDQITLLAQNINNMSEGLGKAVDNAIKSEKMKTELITNVSHDLKTPLTSIITYVDMLKSETIDEETRKSYLAILDKKSKRLKTLVEEIFEASKLSSGEIEFNIEKTDIKELLIQSIVELDDKIQESKLDFIIDTPENPVFTMIDGKRTWRAFENLILNILKYSAPNSRVYIDMKLENNNISIIFKNMSNYRLNLNPDEFLERFRRGDSSRNTEGSGLGLSITQSIVELQNGTMNLSIDGDLFKVILQFKIY